MGDTFDSSIRIPLEPTGISSIVVLLQLFSQARANPVKSTELFLNPIVDVISYHGE
jgi:hypothetical protein